MWKNKEHFDERELTKKEKLAETLAVAMGGLFLLASFLKVVFL